MKVPALAKPIKRACSAAMAAYRPGPLEARAHIRKVLERTANLAEAAQVLGIDQATLYRKRKKIGLE